MSFSIGRAATPPRLILADAGNVRVRYADGHRSGTLAALFGLPTREVFMLLYETEEFEQLERGTIDWETYVQEVNGRLCARARKPQGWSAARFREIWVGGLRGPIREVCSLLSALARHVPVASASNVDPISYDDGIARHPEALAPLTVHSDSFRIGRRKGDEDYFETLLAYVNVRLQAVPPIRPDECVFIDDVVEHVTVAATRGIRTCWFADVASPEGLEASVTQLKIDLERHGVPREWLSQ